MIPGAGRIAEHHITARADIQPDPVIRQEPHDFSGRRGVDSVMDFVEPEEFDRPPDIIRRTAFPDMHPFDQAVLLRLAVQRQECFDRFVFLSAAYVDGPEKTAGQIPVDPVCRFIDIAHGHIGDLGFKNRIRAVFPAKAFNDCPESFHPAGQLDLLGTEVHREPCDMVPLRLGKRAFPPQDDPFASAAVRFDDPGEPGLHARESVKPFRRRGKTPADPFLQPGPPASLRRMNMDIALGNGQQLCGIVLREAFTEQVLRFHHRRHLRIMYFPVTSGSEDRQQKQ